MKITDRMRLDWLMENGQEFMESRCGADCCVEWLKPSRTNIDLEIRQAAAIRARKLRREKR